MNPIKLILGLLLEYALISKLLIKGLNKSVPARWATRAKDPVVLVPGLHETFWTLSKLADFLNAKGHQIHVLKGFKSTDRIESLSKTVSSYIEEKNLENVIVLTHSKGGLVAKHLLSNSPEILARVKQVVSIAVPFGGTYLGFLTFHNLFELKPSSQIINNGQKNLTVNSKFLNLYPEFDNHILPNASLYLDGAENVKIPIIGHTRILECKETLKVLDESF